MTLLLRPSLLDGEGPLGYLFRLAEANGLCLAVLRDLGVHFNLEALLALGYLPAGFLSSPAGKYALAVEAELVANSSAWNRDVPRYCSICLSEAPYWRVEWEILFGDACPHHGVWLHDRCDSCKKLLTWYRPTLLRCECGASLAAQKSNDSPPAVTKLAIMLRNAIVADEGNHPMPLLQGMGLRQLQRLIRFLAAYGDAGAGRRPQKVAKCAHLDVSWQMTSLAAEIVEQWPASFFQLLDRLQEAQNPAASGRLSGRFGYSYAILYRAFPEPEFDFLRRAFEGYVAEHWRGSFGRRNRRLASKMPRQMAWIPANQARQLLGLSQRRLDALVREGCICAEERYGRNARRFLVVRRKDIEDEAEKKKSNVDLTTAASLLGLKRSRMAALLPSLIPEARRTGNAGCPWVIPRGPIDQLLELGNALPEAAMLTPDEVSMAQVLRSWPWSDAAVASLLCAYVAADIAPASRLREPRGINGLVFQTKQIKEWYDATQQTDRIALTIPEVAERLAIKQEVAYSLVRGGLIGSTTVRDGRFEEARVSPESLHSFDERFTFARDLAVSLGTSPRAIADRLSRVGIYPRCGPGVDSCRQLVYEKSDALDRALVLVASNGKGHRNTRCRTELMGFLSLSESSSVASN